MKKILTILACVLVAINVFAFSACEQKSNNIAKYNAVILNDAQQYANEKFLEENVTRGAVFGGLDTLSESYPNEIVYLIKTQSEFEEIFSQFPLSINFEEEMLALYIFTDIYAGFDCEIHKLEVDETALNITLLHDMAEPDIFGLVPPSASSPILRYFVVKLKHIEVNNLKITMIYE